MNAFKSFFVILIVLVLLAGGAYVAIGAVTQSPELPEPEATLTVLTGEVSIQSGEDGVFQQVDQSATVEVGDTIVTGSDGRAEIDFYAQGLLRVETDTTIRIQESHFDPETSTFVGSVFVETGRMWNRFFEFVSPESSYEVETSSTVATIRGTAFSVDAYEDGLADIFVFESEVDVMTVYGDQILDNVRMTAGDFASGEWTQDKNPKMQMKQQSHLDEWVRIMNEKDVESAQNMKQRVIDQARKSSRIDPDSPLYGLVQISEDVRLWMAPEEEKEQLKAEFFQAHLIDAAIMMEHDEEVAQEIIQDASERYSGEVADSAEVQRTMMLLERQGSVPEGVMEVKEVEQKQMQIDGEVLDVQDLKAQMREMIDDVNVQIDLEMTQ